MYFGQAALCNLFHYLFSKMKKVAIWSSDLVNLPPIYAVGAMLLLLLLNRKCCKYVTISSQHHPAEMLNNISAGKKLHVT